MTTQKTKKELEADINYWRGKYYETKEARDKLLHDRYKELSSAFIGEQVVREITRENARLTGEIYGLRNPVGKEIENNTF